MSNYVKAVNFLVKDSLLSGDPAKLIKGTEIDTEFNSIQTASGSKADINSPTLTGVPLSTTAAFGNNTTQIATTAFVQAAATAASSYPIGSIYMSNIATNPAILFGFGVWVAFGLGQVLLGTGGGFTAGTTGGSADAIIPSHTHTATVTDPSHTHALSLNNGSGLYGQTTNGVNNGNAGFTGGQGSNVLSGINSATTGITVANSIAGVSGTNANLPPYIVVYIWNRVS